MTIHLALEDESFTTYLIGTELLESVNILNTQIIPVQLRIQPCKCRLQVDIRPFSDVVQRAACFGVDSGVGTPNSKSVDADSVVMHRLTSRMGQVYC